MCNFILIDFTMNQTIERKYWIWNEYMARGLTWGEKEGKFWICERRITFLLVK